MQLQILEGWIPTTFEYIDRLMQLENGGNTPEYRKRNATLMKRYVTTCWYGVYLLTCCTLKCLQLCRVNQLTYRYKESGKALRKFKNLKSLSTLPLLTGRDKLALFQWLPLLIQSGEGIFRADHANVSLMQFVVDEHVFAQKDATLPTLYTTCFSSIRMLPTSI